MANRKFGWHSGALHCISINFAKASAGKLTTGSLLSTGTQWINFPTAGACGIKLLLANSAVTGDFASLRIRARNDAASGTGINGTATAGNFSASAGVNNFGNLFAVQGYAQPNAYTNTDASNIVCGVYSCIDMTGSTEAGRAWSMWVDTHTTHKAAAGDYLMRLSHNGTATSDGVFTIYNGGRMPALFNFEDVAGCLSVSATALSGVSSTHKLLVTIAGGITAYIPIITTGMN